jgi:hypothetical protein
MRDASEIRFGIEMETLLPTGTCQVGQYHHGTQVAGLPRGWNAQHDGSLHTSLPGYAGVEIVSPILKGADGLRQIAEVCTWLAAKNARVNETCGFHYAERVIMRSRRRSAAAREPLAVGHST